MGVPNAGHILWDHVATLLVGVLVFRGLSFWVVYGFGGLSV